LGRIVSAPSVAGGVKRWRELRYGKVLVFFIGKGWASRSVLSIRYQRPHNSSPNSMRKKKPTWP